MIPRARTRPEGVRKKLAACGRSLPCPRGMVTSASTPPLGAWHLHTARVRRRPDVLRVSKVLPGCDAREGRGRRDPGPSNANFGVPSYVHGGRFARSWLSEPRQTLRTRPNAPIAARTRGAPRVVARHARRRASSSSARCVEPRQARLRHGNGCFATAAPGAVGDCFVGGVYI